MYFYLAIFWFVLGVTLRIFWPTLVPHLRERGITVDTNVISFLCFVLFCYNIIRWRMTRALRQALEKADDGPLRRRRRVTDPEFDFSDQKPDDEKKPPPDAIQK